MKRGTAPLPSQARQDIIAVAKTTDVSPMSPRTPIPLAPLQQAARQFQSSGSQRNLATLLVRRRQVRRALAPGERLELEPGHPTDEQLNSWWRLWFAGDPERGEVGLVWHALRKHPEVIERFLAFGSFLEVDDGAAYGAWPDSQHYEGAAVRVLDGLRLSMIVPRASATNVHADPNAVSVLAIARRANGPKSSDRTAAKIFIKGLRESMRAVPIEQIRQTHEQFKKILKARHEAMELIKEGPYQMPTGETPVSSFKLFARRHAMGLIDGDFFDGIPLSSFLRLPANERRDVLNCFDGKNSGRKSRYHRNPKSAPPGYFKRLLAWLLDNWPVFSAYRWDWKNVFDASQAIGFKHHKKQTDLLKWFSDTKQPQNLNPDRKVGHAKQEGLFSSQKHLLTPAPPDAP